MISYTFENAFVEHANIIPQNHFLSSTPGSFYLKLLLDTLHLQCDMPNCDAKTPGSRVQSMQGYRKNQNFTIKSKISNMHD